MPSFVRLASAVLLAGAAGALALAGNLNPPGGAPAPTMKTLDQVEPRIPVNSTTCPGDSNSVFRINAPGSYYLTGDVTGVAAKTGIKIRASDVTLDLMGYTVRGVPGSVHGVAVEALNANRRNITIRNGIITLWGERGVGGIFDEGQPGTAESMLVESIHASANQTAGIAPQAYCVVRDCVATSNGGFGIAVFAGVVERCVAAKNAGVGFSASGGAVLRQCVAQTNAGGGFSITFASQAEGCTAFNNTGIGIHADSESIVNGCNVRSNTGDGISASFASRILNCEVSFNGADGIELQNECQVIGNTVYRNNDGAPDGAGIHASGFFNRIESNYCIGHERGIDVDMSDNLVIRNTCRANTVNYSITSGNRVGFIVTPPATAMVINGSTGGLGMGSTDPTANLAY